MSKGKVLIVEDDRALAEVVGYNLRQAGYEVHHAYDGRDGISQARLKSPDLIILDVMLPILDGHDVCRTLRAEASTRDVLIMMLTAKTEETDELIGFSIGADDYVAKPFSVKVLLERIKALRRRRTSDALSDDVAMVRGVSVDRSRHQAAVDGRPVELTRSEFRLLDTLIRQPGRVFQRNELINAALGSDNMAMDRTIDVHIRSLRSKLGDSSDAIETVRGVGYRFRDTRLQGNDE